MRRRKAKRDDALERGFAGVLEIVEHAKGELVRAVPSSRAPGAPLAESLLSFETALHDAERGMESWRDDAVAPVWEACGAALAESLSRAERLRMGAPALGFESLLATIAELIAPLDVFERAEQRIRALVRA